MTGSRTALAALGMVLAIVLLAQSALAQESAFAPSGTSSTITVNGKTIVMPPGFKPPPGMTMPPGARPGSPPRPSSSSGRPGPSSGRPGEKPEDKGKDDKSKEASKPGEKKEGEGPEPVTRDSTPPEPPDPDELKIRPDQSGMLHQFNFGGQPWPAVLGWLGEISNMSLDWQELPGGYLNLTTHRSYSVREIRDLINWHLLARGYTLLQRGEFLSVAKTKDINPALVPRVAPEELDKKDPNEFVKVSFPLDWMLAETAVKDLESLRSSNGKLTALAATNRVEAMDAVINLRQMYLLLDQEQGSASETRLVRKFPLKHSLAEDVVGQLQELMGLQKQSSGRGGSPKPMTPDQMRAMQAAAKQAAEAAKKGIVAKPKAEVYLVANKRENSILANAPPDKMEFIAQAILAIDVPSERTVTLLDNPKRMQVYRLQSMDPEAFVKTLEELGDLAFDTRLEVDQENRAIIAYAALPDHLLIQTLIDKLDKGGRRPVIIQLEELRAESVARTIDFMMGGGKEEEESQSRGRSSYPFFFSPYSSRYSSRRSSSEDSDQFRVDADVKTNRLFLWCNEHEQKKVEELLENLRKTTIAGEEDPNTVQTYRLVTLEPEPFVKTLENMETLSFNSKLEVDEDNNAIVAYASPADHEKILELIEQLDGSGRAFEVIPLRRLEADYVAGTIEFMMVGKGEERQSGYSRTYIYDYGYSSRGSRDKKADEFRVDADIENNLLLLWANQLELDEVRNLLVKLGEMPSGESDPRTVRVLEALPDEEVERLLEQIQRMWPSVAPNLLVPPPAEESETDAEEEKKPDEKPAETKRVRTAAAEGASIFRFAQLEASGAQASEQSPSSAEEAVGDSASAEEAVQKAGSPEEAKGEASQPTGEESAAPAGSDPAHKDTEEKASEPAAPSGPPPSKKAGTPPPVSITRGPDGRLVIASDDTKALDLLQELIGRLAPLRQDYRIYPLKYAYAWSLMLTLEDMFEEEEEKPRRSGYPYFYDPYYSSGSSQGKQRSRLSSRRPIKFLCDDSSNSIIVQNADPTQLAKIERLIEHFDNPEPADSESLRKTEIFAIKYATASIVAEAIKDVYRDLLSARDKALVNNQRQRELPERSYTYIYSTGGDGDRKEERTPSFKGLLSIGVDDLSNSLVISAPGYLMENLRTIVEQLDELAKPAADTVQVLQVGGLSGPQIQEVLSKVLSQRGSSRRTSAKTPPRPPTGGPTPNRSSSRRTRSSR